MCIRDSFSTVLPFCLTTRNCHTLYLFLCAIFRKSRTAISPGIHTNSVGDSKSRISASTFFAFSSRRVRLVIVKVYFPTSTGRSARVGNPHVHPIIQAERVSAEDAFRPLSAPVPSGSQGTPCTHRKHSLPTTPNSAEDCDVPGKHIHDRDHHPSQNISRST